MASLINGHEFEQTPGDGEGQGRLACLWSMGSQRVRHNLASEQEHARFQYGSPVYLQRFE